MGKRFFIKNVEKIHRLSHSGHMIIHKTIGNIPQTLQNCVVTMGNFDGIHRGHQAVIGEAKKQASALDAPLVVLTFDPHPRTFFKPGAQPFLIAPLDGKIPHLKALGVDGIIALNFADIKDMCAEDFIRIVLVENIKIQVLSVGYDFQFGKDRKGNINMLKNHTLFRTVISPPQTTTDGKIFSSTRIRNLIRLGQMEHATALLGHPFEIHGAIVKGQQLAKQLGFPTANISLNGYVRPKYGVYAVRVGVEKDTSTVWYDGVANFGIRPTTKNPEELFEAHIFDFDDCLYDQSVRVAIIRFIRPEKKFDTFADLKKQIADDCVVAKRIHASRYAGA